MDKPIYEYDNDKHLKLIKERGIGFEDVIALLDAEGPMAIIDHPNKTKYPRQ